MPYLVEKYYPHSLGLSACFAQPDADSHCRYPHGYALSFRFKFWAKELNRQHWVLDFGKLKPLREWLVHTFDHRMMIAHDDHVMLEAMQDLKTQGRASIMIVDRVGCESFARLAFIECETMLKNMGEYPRVKLLKVTVAEHEGNSASYYEP